MTNVINRNPVNPNPLHVNKFIFNMSRIPNVQYFCQDVIIPGVNITEAVRPNPFVDLYSPGEKLVYDLFVVTFIIDENLTAWKEIHDWMRAMTFPENFEEYANLKNISRNPISNMRKGFEQFSDAEVLLLTSSNIPKVRYKFYDLFPTNISPIMLTSRDSPNNIMTADATFRYAYYDIEII